MSHTLWVKRTTLFLLFLTIGIFAAVYENVQENTPTDVWAVELEEKSLPFADEIAQQHGYDNLGKLPFGNYFIFKRNPSKKRSVMANLETHPAVQWSENQIPRKREKRSRISPRDPLYMSQWHLQGSIGRDINVGDAWEAGFTGKGVTVCIVDDGVEKDHPDLKENFRADGSYDFNYDKPFPVPAYYDSHGTESAGTACASLNTVCGVGVAFHANVTGVKILGAPVTDHQESLGLSHKTDKINDIMSNSWGPDDDGLRLEGPGVLSRAAIQYGIQQGRGGLGTIYTWAAGNGRRKSDNCNYDGYANSRYTLTVGALDHSGTQSWYSEDCSAMMVVTPSSGERGYNILTTDLTGTSGASRDECSTTFGGTSASSPMLAGVVALVLEANRRLTWRDVQQVIMKSAVQTDITNSDWQTNGAGYKISHHYGFGKVDAARAVNLAREWTLLPSPEKQYAPPTSFSLLSVLPQQQVTTTITANSPLIIEYVEIKVSLTHPSRGNIAISLASPSGVVSRLAEHRGDPGQNVEWTFGSVFYLDETPTGTWTLTVHNNGPFAGTLNSWSLMFYGH
eukprot:TRINITY_DN10875_c0_g1_i1.p1 TRINITY_DN10875_c0_g1~~TRINITY_DN10875_c0_g1_i1.p1  ORF type:complete len:566 (-),score=131.21 TRINITY_DN10875_c0_g1_i1:158-1855(-)